MESLETLMKNYLKNCKEIKKLDSKTLKAYRTDLSQFDTFMLKHTIYTDKIVISEYISLLHQRFQPKTVKRKIASIKAFYHYLMYEEKISLNPFDKINVKFREPITLPRTIPETTISTFISTMYKQRRLAKTTYQNNMILRDIAVVELLFATGVRISELCTLTIQQVDLSSYRIIIFEKGSKERRTQISSNAVRMILLEYYTSFKSNIVSSGCFFVNKLHQRYSDPSARYIIAKCLNTAKIGLHISLTCSDTLSQATIKIFLLIKATLELLFIQSRFIIVKILLRQGSFKKQCNNQLIK